MHQLKIIIFVLNVFWVGQITHAQKTIGFNDTVEFIKWVNVYPNKDVVKQVEFKKKLGQLIFGKKELELVKPISLIGSDSSMLVVLDQTSGSIIKFNNGEMEIPTFILKQKAFFSSLVSISHFKDEAYLFTDSSEDKVYILDINNKKLKKFNNETILAQPTGIAYSSITQEVWVVETSAHQISVFDKEGNKLRTIGKRGNGDGEFNFPTFIWIDNLGNVYIVDSMNFRVQVFDKDGKVVSVFGEAGDATGYFARPKGVATDSYGNIYIADALFHTIQIFDGDGQFLYQFGSQGQGNGEFWMPSGIFIDDENYIYVADSYNARIQVFKLMK